MVQLTMVRREVLSPIDIILCPQVLPIRLVMIGSIHTRSRLLRSIRCRSVRQMASKHQQVSWRQFHGDPSLRTLPALVNSSAFRKLHVHFVAAWHHLHAAVFDSCSIYGQVRSRVLNFANVVVSGSVEVSLESVATRHLVVDLVLEKQHVIARELGQKTGQVFASQQLLKALVEIDEVFGAHDLAFTGGGNLVVGHPFAVFSWKISDFLRPIVQGCGVYQLVLISTEDEEAMVVEVLDLFLSQLDQGHDCVVVEPRAIGLGDAEFEN